MRTAEFPIESAANLPVVEIKGDEEAYVSGCNKILEYSTERVIFEGGRFHITVTGKCMILEDYNSGCVCIRGYVCAVEVERS